MSKTILMVVANNGFRDEEYVEPRKVLEDSGINIKVASLEGGEAEGISGKKITSNLYVSEANINDFDGVAFIGGPGMVSLVNDAGLVKLAKDFHGDESKLVTAICVAPAILANAGLLQGKKATSTSSAVETLKEKGAIYNGANVEVDGRIITADGPTSATEFGETIVNALK